MSLVSNGLYFLTLLPVSVTRVIYQKIRHARYLYIKRNGEKVWGARYTLGARYLSKNTVITFVIGHYDAWQTHGDTEEPVTSVALRVRWQAFP